MMSNFPLSINRLILLHVFLFFKVADEDGTDPLSPGPKFSAITVCIDILTLYIFWSVTRTLPLN